MAEDSQANGLFFTNTLATQQFEEETDLDHVEPRQATLFLIDMSPQMFEEIPDSEETPFLKSVLVYKNNMQMLCGYNRDDSMSLILLGTTEWDKNPETKNVLTVQKFQKVSLQMLREIIEKIENHREYFNLLSSLTEYPLRDALWHAAQAFSAVKTVVITKRIILFTCEDNPLVDDPAERHRIRTRVSTFKNLDIDFRVIGLKNGFDHNRFYKELEIISSGMSPQTYKPLKLEDLEAEIQFPSRTISNISWMFSNDVVVPVSIFTVATETKFPESVSINKETNEPLKSFQVYKKQDEEGDDFDDVEEEGKFDSKVVAAGGIAKYQEHGEKKIVFDVKELDLMFNQFTKGIETLCFKPILCDPMYHVESPKFLTLHKTDASESQKQFFTTLIDKCVAKELMAVCRISYRIHTAPNIFYLYPSAKKGGFYIYKMAYDDHIRNLDEVLSTWIYNDDWEHSPDQDALNVFEKIVRKTRIRFDPNVFKNPKLGTLIANIEALALDLNELVVPADSTLPSRQIGQRLAEILPEYYEVFPEAQFEVPAKRRKIMDDAQIREHVQRRDVDKLTVAVLKEFLTQHKVSVTNARKADLVKKVYEFCESN